MGLLERRNLVVNPSAPHGPRDSLKSVTVHKLRSFSPISTLVGIWDISHSELFVVRAGPINVIGIPVLFFFSLSSWCPYFFCFSLIITTSVSGIIVNEKIVCEIGKAVLFSILLIANKGSGVYVL